MAYPENPKTFLFMNKYYRSGLKELSIWNHYQKYKKQIIKEATTPILLFLYTEGGYVVKRKLMNAPILLSSHNYDSVITGRTVSLSMETPKQTDYALVDIDSGEGTSEFEMKECVKELLGSSLVKATNVRDTKITSSASGYHLYIFIKGHICTNIKQKLQML